MRGKGHKIDLSKVNWVLVIRVDEIGDVVMTSPFLRELRHLLPNARIALLVKPAARDLVELCPYVDEVLNYDWDVSLYLGPLQRNWRALHLAYRILWSHRFDLAILPRWDFDDNHATFLAYLSGAPWRVGYSEGSVYQKQLLNRGFNRLLTHVMDDSVLKHEVEHNLDVIRFLGGAVQEDRLELWLSKEDELFVEQLMMLERIQSNDLLIAFGPGARETKRIWPLSNFTEIGNWLKKSYNSRIIVLGGKGEERLGGELQKQLGETVINLVGKTTLRQTCALLKRCRLYVGNDAGPMHLAAAAGVPVVEISCHPKTGSPFYQNSPKRFRPWGVPHTVVQPATPQPPCLYGCDVKRPHCILVITVDQVKEAVAEQLRALMTPADEGVNSIGKN
jgi:heptosyltransferase-2